MGELLWLLAPVLFGGNLIGHVELSREVLILAVGSAGASAPRISHGRRCIGPKNLG